MQSVRISSQQVPTIFSNDTYPYNISMPHEHYILFPDDKILPAPNQYIQQRVVIQELAAFTDW